MIASSRRVRFAVVMLAALALWSVAFVWGRPSCREGIDDYRSLPEAIELLEHLGVEG